MMGCMRLTTRILRKPLVISSSVVFSPLANIAFCRASLASSAGAGRLRSGDWSCPRCKCRNFARSASCFKCLTHRANDGSGSFRASGRIPRMNNCGDVEAVLDVFHKFGPKMKPNDLGSAWNRIGKLAGFRRSDQLWLQRNPEALNLLLERTLPVMEKFSAQSLANTAHGMAKVGSKTGWRPGRGVWDCLAESAEPQLAKFAPQALANTAWAFATAGHQAPALFDALAQAAPRQLAEFNPQDFSNIAWAFATAEHQAPALFEALADEVPQNLAAFTPQGLANTAWAFATAGHQAPALFDALAEAAPRRLAEFNPQDFSNIAWAFATAEQQSPALFGALAGAAPQHVAAFEAQHLANTAWAFATAGHHAPALFDALANAAPRRLTEFNPQNLCNTAWAFAVADVRSDQLFGAASPFPDLCNAQFEQFTTANLSQLHQWLLWHQENGQEPALSLDLIDQCFNAFVERNTKASNLQREVVAVLASLDVVVSVEEEVQNTSGYSLDAVATLRGGQKVGLEVDGPSHFIGSSHKPTGNTMIKRRQLMALDGCHSVPLPYWEIDHANKEGTHGLSVYLNHKLHLALESLSREVVRQKNEG